MTWNISHIPIRWDVSFVPYCTSIGLALLCLLPIFLGWNIFYGSTLDSDSGLYGCLNSSYLIGAAASSIAIPSVICIEYFMDMVTNIEEDKQVHISRHGIFPLILPCVAFFFAKSFSLPESIPMIFHSEAIFIFHIFLWYMNYFGPSIWNIQTVLICGTLFTVHQIFQSFEPFISYNVSAWEYCASGCFILSQLIVFGKSYIWWRHILFSSKVFAIDDLGFAIDSTPLSDYCCSLYLLAYQIGTIIILILYSIIGTVNWVNINPGYLASQVLAYAVFTSIAITGHLRVTRINFNSRKVSL